MTPVHCLARLAEKPDDASSFVSSGEGTSAERGRASEPGARRPPAGPHLDETAGLAEASETTRQSSRRLNLAISRGPRASAAGCREAQRGHEAGWAPLAPSKNGATPPARSGARPPNA